MSGSAVAAIDQLKLPVRNVLNGVNRQQFFAGGSVMRVTTDPSQPVMAGMPKDADIFVFGSPAFETTAGFDGAVLATYPNDGSPLRSGYLLGEKYLQWQGRGARCAARRRPRDPARLPPAVARPAVRHVPRPVQLDSQISH